MNVFFVKSQFDLAPSRDYDLLLILHILRRQAAHVLLEA